MASLGVICVKSQGSLTQLLSPLMSAKLPIPNRPKRKAALEHAFIGTRALPVQTNLPTISSLRLQPDDISQADASYPPIEDHELESDRDILVRLHPTKKAKVTIVEVDDDGDEDLPPSCHRRTASTSPRNSEAEPEEDDFKELGMS